MRDKELRLQALQLAMELGGDYKKRIEIASHFYSFILNGKINGEETEPKS